MFYAYFSQLYNLLALDSGIQRNHNDHFYYSKFSLRSQLTVIFYKLKFEHFRTFIHEPNQLGCAM